MTKARTFSVKSLISKVGKSLIKDSEEQLNSESKYHLPKNTYSLSDPNNINSSLDEELHKLKLVYKKAKYNLENRFYNPIALSQAEAILLNKSNIIFTCGEYTDYIFQSYSSGYIYLLGPIDILSFDKQGNITCLDNSKDPRKIVPLLDAFQFMTVECKFPLRGLKGLSTGNDFFLSMDSTELETHLHKLSLELIK